MKNAVFWDVAPCIYCANRRFGGTYRLYLEGRKIRERGASMSRWLQTESPIENTELYKNAGRCILGSLAPRLLGQCFPGNPASFPPPPTRSYTGSSLLPAGPSPQILPLSSLFISHVAHTLPFLFLYRWVF
jgi:hypothetical protein